MKKKVIRVNVTFWVDEDSEYEIHDRLDDLLVEHFGPEVVDDWHTRWTHTLDDLPLFGAAQRKVLSAREEILK